MLLKEGCQILRISEVDHSLYNETFVGKAKVLQCCNICLSELHTKIEYNLVSNSHPTTQATQSAGWHTGEKKSVPICLLYNDREGNRCTYAPDCKYSHTRSAFRGRHPFSKCPNRCPHPYAARDYPDMTRQRRK